MGQEHTVSWEGDTSPARSRENNAMMYRVSREKLASVAYFAAVPALTIKTSGTLVAGVFGHRAGARVLPALVSLSILSYPAIWASTRPFGTPLASVLLKWLLTVIVIIAPPAGDAVAFLVNLQSYPANVFSFDTAVAVFMRGPASTRVSRLANIELPSLPASLVYNYFFHEYRLTFSWLVNVFLLVMLWYPPASGRDSGDAGDRYKLVEETMVSPDRSA
ncbi:hypothetical protein DFH08DRAFT_977582 [Mycena albidolilacea]|uniref:Uncharacterized protein n=1 Tax=Mycena albidolilacea TaxID=1033008 RepID=A0AAD6Z0G1_9AGAR|nr:hypothetical protein DFH08DRAFT_977582 [Mycena albidolilacea]